MKRLTIFFMTAIFAIAGTSAGGVKYIAVVETDVDAASGASADINPAEVREITAEIRRQATEHLPLDRYNVMTSETVQSMGGAVLEDCSEENCVITLGARIGADFIVRGTVNKFQTRFTLAVELYETDNGTLVVTSEAVRSENLGELLDKASAACANMFKKFVGVQSAMQKPQIAAADDAEPKTKPKKEKPAPKPKPEPKPKPAPKPIEWPPIRLSAGGGAFLANDFGGGLNWGDGVQVTTPYSGGGAYLFLDATYAEASAGLSGGGGKWESNNVLPSDTTILPDMPRLYINIGVLAKYPIGAGNVKLFPLLGIDYEAALSAKLNAGSHEYPFDGNEGRHAASALNALWLKFGAGVDAALGQKLYLRAELLYGLRGTNKFEEEESVADSYGAKSGSAGGFTVRVGAGVNL